MHRLRTFTNEPWSATSSSPRSTHRASSIASKKRTCESMANHHISDIIIVYKYHYIRRVCSHTMKRKNKNNMRTYLAAFAAAVRAKIERAELTTILLELTTRREGQHAAVPRSLALPLMVSISIHNSLTNQSFPRCHATGSPLPPTGLL